MARQTEQKGKYREDQPFQACREGPAEMPLQDGLLGAILFVWHRSSNYHGLSHERNVIRKRMHRLFQGPIQPPETAVLRKSPVFSV